MTPQAVQDALKEGYTQEEIARELAGEEGFKAATGEGYTPGEIIDHMIGQPHHYGAAEAQAMAAQARQSDPTVMPSAAAGSKLQNFAAGAGSAARGLVLGAGQLFGVPGATEAIKESASRDAALMQMPGGRAGSIAGTVATAVPTAFIPGANTYGGAALIGAGMGLANPVAADSTKDIVAKKLMGAGAGAIGGTAGLAVGRGIGSVLGAAKGLLYDPLTERGQKYIASILLREHANDPAQVAAALREAGSGIPGYQPTVAEALGPAEPGIAQLQRTAHDLDPTKLLARRDVENANAIRDTLRGIAGTPEDMANAQTARATLTGPAYESAANQSVPMDDALQSILARPSMSKALARAQQLANERGVPVRFGQSVDARPDLLISGEAPQYTGRGLQFLKMAMDDLTSGDPAVGITGNELRAMQGTKQDLVGWIENNIPEYAGANRMYRALSEPIDQMNVGESIYNRAIGPLSDFSPSGSGVSLRANAFADALRNADRTVRGSVDVPSGRTIEDVMRPDQMATLNEVGRTLAGRAEAQTAGRSSGSPTGENLVSQNLVRQIAGPLGLPEAAWNNSWMPTIARIPEFLLHRQEEGLGTQLSRILADPAAARAALLNATQPTVPALIGNAAGRVVSPFGMGLGASFAQ